MKFVLGVYNYINIFQRSTSVDDNVASLKDMMQQ